MKAFGWLIAVVGVCYVIFAFNMDVSVSTPSTYIPGYGSVGGGDVANLDLMARRQNHLIFASVIILVGVLLGLFAPSAATSNATTAPVSEPETPAKFDGARDLSNDGYRFWLADTYHIARNDVFDRFVMGDATFSTLNDALAKADEIERKKMAAEDEAKRQIKEAAEKRRLEELAFQEKQDAKWEKQKPWAIAAVLAMLLGSGVIIHLAHKATEEREAAKALVRKEKIKLLSEKWRIQLPSQIIRDAHDARESESFLCGDVKGDEIFEINSEASISEIQDDIGKSLGEMNEEYAVDGGGSWYWSRDDVRADLNLIAGSIKLCLQKID